MPHRILVVDDHPLQVRVLARQLEALGHRAICTDDAEEGCLLFSVGRFDLVFAGAGVVVGDARIVQRMRAIEHTQSRAACAIVACGAGNAGSDALHALVRERVVHAWVDTPIPMERLAALLASLLHDAPAAATDASERWALFESTSREDLLAARAALADGRRATVQASLHRIKGAAQMLQRDALAAACADAEERAATADAADVRECIDLVERQLQQAAPSAGQPGAIR